MTKTEKLLQRIRKNPNQVSFADIDLVLRHAGYELRKVVGSHHVYRKPGATTISIPYQRPHIKPSYVKDILAIIDEDASTDELTKGNQRHGK